MCIFFFFGDFIEKTKQNVFESRSEINDVHDSDGTLRFLFGNPVASSARGVSACRSRSLKKKK